MISNTEKIKRTKYTLLFEIRLETGKSARSQSCKVDNPISNLFVFTDFH